MGRNCIAIVEIVLQLTQLGWAGSVLQYTDCIVTEAARRTEDCLAI